jgi:hypothetical protein
MDAPTFAWPPPSGKSGEKEKEEENGEGKGEKFSMFNGLACLLSESHKKLRSLVQSGTKPPSIRHENGSGHIAIFFQHACRTEVFDPSNSKNSLCLEFSDLCKSAMVNKEWREAIKSTLPLLKTLRFTFLPKE